MYRTSIKVPVNSQVETISDITRAVHLHDYYGMDFGFPQASVQCLDNKGGSPGFGQLQKLDCGLTLDELQENITENSVQVANNVQILTSKPQSLTPDNVTTAAVIVTKLLDSTPTEEVAVAAVATVSQLLNASVTAGGAVNSSATNSLTLALERLSLQQKNNASLVVQPNLVVQSVGGLGRANQGVAFSALTGLSEQFVANRIRLNTNASEIVDSTTGPTDVQILLRFQPGTENASVGFVLHQNDRLFQSVRFKTLKGTNRRVISASVGGKEKLSNVEMRFRPTNVLDAGLQDFACVFWDYDVQDWSTEGCTKQSRSPGSLGCTCNHTTNFAVLMSFRDNYSYAEELNWISIIGCSLSIAGVSLTIMFYIVTRSMRKANVTLLLVSICSSMLVFYFLFLFGINNQAPAPEKANVLLLSDQHAERDLGGCTAVTALLHYFLLATFTWNTIYATLIFLLVQCPFQQHGRRFTIATLVTGWGLPAIIVAVSLGTTYRPHQPMGYRQEEFTKPRSSMKKLMSSFSLSVILGLSWILGYLLLIDTKGYNRVLSIVFCLLTATQGLQIFILFTVRTSVFMKKMAELLTSIPTPKVTLHQERYSLWKRLWNGPRERYKSTEEQSTSQF
ncbi:hypothetical protein SKAU_G00304900 [Synaphobranchus kaupii]|uniref:Adhesion G-protein coupled receptor G7-like n=1 Tax=Synaphobranchus kaupii TaxID=118154 RepID=A0A9Q1EWB6_SYNKA|nr:hypothetical protein SKAU_G00304900 [Synaphobranchus kaupii]